MNKVEMVNLALTALGTTTITSLDDDSSEEARVMKNLFNPTLEEVLALYPWPSAMKRDRLAEKSGAAEFTVWGHGYQIPSDCVFIVSLLSPSDFSELENLKGDSRPSPTSTPLYEREGSVLYTDLDECIVKYVKFPVDPEYLRDVIGEAVALRLAQKAAVSIGRDISISQNLEQRFEVAFLRAKAAESMDHKGEPKQTKSWEDWR